MYHVTLLSLCCSGGLLALVQGDGVLLVSEMVGVRCGSVLLLAPPSLLSIPLSTYSCPLSRVSEAPAVARAGAAGVDFGLWSVKVGEVGGRAGVIVCHCHSAGETGRRAGVVVTACLWALCSGDTRPVLLG